MYQQRSFCRIQDEVRHGRFPSVSLDTWVEKGSQTGTFLVVRLKCGVPRPWPAPQLETKDLFSFLFPIDQFTSNQAFNQLSGVEIDCLLDRGSSAALWIIISLTNGSTVLVFVCMNDIGCMPLRQRYSHLTYLGQLEFEKVRVP